MADSVFSEYAGLLDALRARLEEEKWFGESHLPRGAAAPATKTSGSIVMEKAARLADLEKVVQLCARCPLKKTRTNLVFGEGNPAAEIMFVGEAPGHDEDLQGRPFVGKAGQLLTRIIQAMGMQREDVYIANILKCRPPENRTPHLTEITSCARYIFQQINIIKPKVIVGLGNIAVKALLNTDQSISSLRGKLHDFDGMKLMPTYHPAYLLRNPYSKSDVWDDIKKVLAYLGKPIPKSSARA